MEAGAAYVCGTSSLTFTNCTFVRNSSPIGAALYCEASSRLDRTIVAFNNQGEGVYCESGVSATCCDIYGNTGGDWTGCLQEQLGQNGNVCADPRFCDLEHGDCTIEADSPCNRIPCGIIGAWPVGCPATGVAEAMELRAPTAIPNPMRGSCRVLFPSPRASRVSVEVLDSAGRVVQRLLDSPDSAGDVSISWNGRDDRGRVVAAGVYLVRMSSSAGQASTRLVVLR